MKSFTAILALSSITSVFAAPTPKRQLLDGLLGGVIGDVEGIVSGVVSVVEGVLPIGTILAPLGIDEITGLVKTDVSSIDVIQTVTNLLGSTQGHSKNIVSLLGNSTTAPTTAVLNLVAQELTVVYSEVAAVTQSLSPITGLVFSELEVSTLAKTLVGVVGGIATPVFGITGALGLNTVLTPVLGDVTGIVGQAVVVVDGVASGVLGEVTGLLNVAGVSPIVDSVLAGLIPGLLSGDLSGLTGLLSL